MLTQLLPRLEAQEDYSNDALYQTLSKYVEEKGVKNGYVMWPVRTAVSGKQTTPAGGKAHRARWRGGISPAALMFLRFVKPVIVGISTDFQENLNFKTF